MPTNWNSCDGKNKEKRKTTKQMERRIWRLIKYNGNEKQAGGNQRPLGNEDDLLEAMTQN
jgi:hypothetical protein